MLSLSAPKSGQPETELSKFWRWMYEMTKNLGTAGTSSDESDGDGSRRLIKVMPWRRKLDDHWKAIDEAYARNKSFMKSPKGAKSVPCFRHPDNPRSSRGAPKVAQDFYDPEWVQEIGEREFEFRFLDEDNALSGWYNCG